MIFTVLHENMKKIRRINTPRGLGFTLGWNGGMTNVMVQVVQTNKFCLVTFEKIRTYHQTSEFFLEELIISMHQDITPPQSNISSKEQNSKRVNSTLAFNVEHEIHSRNNLPATDIEKGWIIDSGASAHMTSDRKSVV